MWVQTRTDALEGCKCSYRGQKAAQHNRSRHADAIPPQVEGRDGVVAQGGERNAAEVGERWVLEHHLGQLLSNLSTDAIAVDTDRPSQR